MFKKPNLVFQFIILLNCFLLFGCLSDLSIKNIHENSEATPLPPETPIPEPPSKDANITESKKNITGSEISREEDIKLTNLELQKFAYELGFDPKKEITATQKQEILNRKKLRQLERTLDSQKERLQYSKILPWFADDQEKIEFLTIPTIEGRQVWINKNKIWSRAKDLRYFDDIVESQDIALGMPADYVRKSWGEPTTIESSGNPIYKNERWQYLKQVSTPQGYKQEKRLVYFEGGRVAGWETE